MNAQENPPPVRPAVSFAGRSAHRWLVGIPVLLYLATLVSFAMYASTDDGGWLRYAFLVNLAAVASAVVTAGFGAADFTQIPKDHPARQPATAHALLQVAVLGLFSGNLLEHIRQLRDALRGRIHEDYVFDPSLAIGMTGGAVVLLLCAGVIGFYMAHRLRVGEVDTDDVHPGRGTAARPRHA